MHAHHATRYTQWFSETAQIIIRGTEHKLSSDHLCVEVFVRTSRPGYHGLVPYFLPWWYKIDPITRDVAIFLMTNRHEVNVQLSLAIARPGIKPGQEVEVIR